MLTSACGVLRRLSFLTFLVHSALSSARRYKRAASPSRREQRLSNPRSPPTEPSPNYPRSTLHSPTFFASFFCCCLFSALVVFADPSCLLPHRIVPLPFQPFWFVVLSFLTPTPSCCSASSNPYVGCGNTSLVSTPRPSLSYRAVSHPSTPLAFAHHALNAPPSLPPPSPPQPVPHPPASLPARRSILVLSRTVTAV